ncbi:hypothetical protein BJF92_11765 [Rhizobium rhizosphaerae]|uniref:Uncharacterized protein n=1 Tax=Xaviernesmea rhizosphaerae TaxID=1672749 RepID=A0A1Q9AMX0_9HYPH|nr:hypothetical protein BJF92_11765 [Xaviernesmea rhizosphaerae]
MALSIGVIAQSAVTRRTMARRRLAAPLPSCRDGDLASRRSFLHAVMIFSLFRPGFSVGFGLKPCMQLLL